MRPSSGRMRHLKFWEAALFRWRSLAPSTASHATYAPSFSLLRSLSSSSTNCRFVTAPLPPFSPNAPCEPENGNVGGWMGWCGWVSVGGWACVDWREYACTSARARRMHACAHVRADARMRGDEGVRQCIRRCLDSARGCIQVCWDARLRAHACVRVTAHRRTHTWTHTHAWDTTLTHYLALALTRLDWLCCGGSSCSKPVDTHRLAQPPCTQAAVQPTLPPK